MQPPGPNGEERLMSGGTARRATGHACETQASSVVAGPLPGRGGDCRSPGLASRLPRRLHRRSACRCSEPESRRMGSEPAGCSPGEVSGSDIDERRMPRAATSCSRNGPVGRTKMVTPECQIVHAARMGPSKRPANLVWVEHHARLTGGLPRLALRHPPGIASDPLQNRRSHFGLVAILRGLVGEIRPQRPRTLPIKATLRTTERLLSAIAPRGRNTVAWHKLGRGGYRYRVRRTGPISGLGIRSSARPCLIA